MKGDRAEAARRLTELARTVESEPADANRRIVAVEFAALNGSMAERDVVNAMHNDVLLLKHAYFFMGVNAWAASETARAKAMFRRAESQSFDLDFPLLAARRLAS